MVTNAKPLFGVEVFADQAAVDSYVQSSKTVVPIQSDTVSLDYYLLLDVTFASMHAFCPVAPL